MALDDIHRKYLNDHAVSDDVIEATQIYSAEGEIVFPWRDGDLITEQRRPWPGEAGTYYWEAGKDLHFWNLIDAGPTSPVLVVEGTKQSLATASNAPDGYSVLGMAGCEGWNKCDLSRFEGRTIYVCLDADAGTNLSVWEAGDLLRQEAEFYDADVKYLWLPARGTQGMDDVLAKKPGTHRRRFVEYLIGKAEKKPAEKKPLTRKGAKMDTIMPDTGDRVGVAVNLDRKDVIDKITGAMKSKLDGTVLFNYGEVITRVRGHETKPLDKDSFHAMIADSVACYRYTPATEKRPAVFEPTWPDPQTIGSVMSKAEEFSTLKRVVRVPFIRPDGSVCTTPGYDADTHTVLVLDGLDVDVPENPSQTEVRAAAKFLMDDWLGDFPLLTDADRTNCLGLLLTPFIRGIVPLVPLAVVNGLEAGVGKNLLVDCIHILATGEVATPLPWVSNDEEMRKQITSAFASGAEIFPLDEAHVLEGAQVSRALTSVTYGDRILGVSRIAKFPNSVTWISMGNQVQVNGDMSRRVYFIALRPVGTTLADRDQRQYRHEDLKLWTAQNRAQLVSAALTVLRGWYAAGSPRYSRGSSMGSFEPWDRLVSSVTAYAGFPHFLTDMKERRSESDFEASYWEAHVTWLRSTFGDSTFTTRQVQEQALRDPRGYEAPPGKEDPAGKDYTRTLGQAYSRHQDRRYGSLRLVKSGMGHRSTMRWSVREDNGGTEGLEGTPTPPHVGNTLSPSVPACDVARVEGGGDPTPPTPPSLQEAPRKGVIGFDLETASAKELFTGNHEGPFVRLCGLVEDSQPEGTTGTSVNSLRDSLMGAEVNYGHNILGYDHLALAHHHGADYDSLVESAVDTMVLARLADPPGAKGMLPWGARGYYGLDQVARRLGHEGKSADLKTLADKWGGHDKIPPTDPEYNAYLRGDLSATRFVYEQLTKDGISDYAKREMRVVGLIQNRMTLNGWKVDTELLAERVAEEAAKVEQAKGTLAEFGVPLNEPDKIRLKLKKDWPQEMAGLSMTEARAVVADQPDKAVSFGLATRAPGKPRKSPWATDAGREALIKALRDAGAEHYPKTATGQLALSSEALGDGWWVNHNGERRPGLLRVYPDLPKVREIVETLALATGATSKYAEIQKYVVGDRVHPEISGSRPEDKDGSDQASGRWAMRHPSLTNLGKRGEKLTQRAPFIADDGHLHVSADLSQVDMRGVAALSQDQAYMELFAPGRDAHMDMAEVYFGERTKDARSRTKAINHGLNYGQGDKAVAERNGLPLELVNEASRRRAEAYPRLIEWTNEVRLMGESGALLDNGFGRLMRCDPQRAWTQAPALMGQGAARDIMCESLLRLIDRDRRATQYLRGVVHDEVILSVPEGDVDYWQELIKDAFTWEWKGVPILCDLGTPARRWSECYAGE